MRRPPALIVGGGPAGAAAAIALAQGGVRATILERQRETGDALCGGFLSWRSLAALEQLGVTGDRLGGTVVRRLRLYAGTRVAEATLPRPARALSRHRLDTLLLARAAESGAGIERGVMVQRIAGSAAFVEGAALTGDALLLATGKHDLRGVGRPHTTTDPTLGLRVRLSARASVPVGDAIELHLFDRGYAGLVMQEDGANLCLAVRRSRLRQAGSPEALLRAIGIESAHLAERLAHWPGGQVDAVANIPYGWRAGGGAPFYRLGDQAGVIPSLAGEGMSIALASGVSAARAITGGMAPEHWQRRFSRQLTVPITLADLIWRAGERPAIASLLPLLAHPRLVHAVAGATRVA